MILVKENKSKKRQVFYDGNFYYKKWLFSDPIWLEDHYNILLELCPYLPYNFYYDSASMTLVTNKIQGSLASQQEHTRSFINFIYDSCIDNIIETSPYYHGDWSLSNMIISNNTVIFIDWDNVNYYPRDAAIEKLHHDLSSAFGDKFLRKLNDSASI